MDKVNVGLVGAAGHLAAVAHGNALLANERVKLIALCDVDREALDERARRWNVSKCYADYREMLEDTQVDVVDIVTPPLLHAPIAIDAARAGKHVIVEKPMCTSLREADDMIRAARKSGVKLMMAESYVFITPHMKARALIEAGKIGEPMHIRQMKGLWRNRARPPGWATSRGGEHPWRLHPVRSGGGQYPWLMDHGVHFFATARYLMNDVEIEEVFALSRPWHRRGNEELRDVPVVVWQYEGGEKHGVWSRADEMADTFDHLGFRTEVYGTEGMLVVLGEGGGPSGPDTRPAPLVLRQKGSTTQFNIDEGPDWWWDSVVNYYDRAHRNEIDHFVDCVLHDRRPRYTGEDGKRDVQCTLAAIKSAIDNRPVDVNSVPLDWTAYSSA